MTLSADAARAALRFDEFSTRAGEQFIVVSAVAYDSEAQQARPVPALFQNAKEGGLDVPDQLGVAAGHGHPEQWGSTGPQKGVRPRRRLLMRFDHRRLRR